MTPAEYSSHVDLVGKVVKAELRSYWTAKPDPEVDALEVTGWVEELEDWSIDEIRAGFAAWVNDNPNKRPNRGHISQLLKQARGKAWAASNPRQPEAPRGEPCSREAAAEIMARAGFAPRRASQ